jgi:hypothetical protein
VTVRRVCVRRAAGLGFGPPLVSAALTRSPVCQALGAPG